MLTLVTKIINKNNQGYPVLTDSIRLNDFDTVCEVNVMDDPTLINGIDFDEMENMGVSSYIECYLSQHREEHDDDDVVNATKPPNTYYKEALPLLKIMVNSFPNKHMFDEMCQFIRNRHMVYIASRGINPEIRNSPGITLFGENNTHKRVMKRHKFIYERWTIQRKEGNKIIYVKSIIYIY